MCSKSMYLYSNEMFLLGYDSGIYVRCCIICWCVYIHTHDKEGVQLIKVKLIAAKYRQSWYQTVQICISYTVLYFELELYNCQNMGLPVKNKGLKSKSCNDL